MTIYFMIMALIYTLLFFLELFIGEVSDKTIIFQSMFMIAWIICEKLDKLNNPKQ